MHSWDHVFPAKTRQLNTTIRAYLYGVYHDPAFGEFHSVLSQQQDITYILRYSFRSPVIPTKLSGFGVSLHIKNMEYKAIDDREIDDGGKGKEAGVVKEEDIDDDEVVTSLELQPKNAVASDGVSSVDLTIYDLSSLGVATALYIITSYDQYTNHLELLRDVAVDFPLLASKITKRAKAKKSKARTIKYEMSRTASTFGGNIIYRTILHYTYGINVLNVLL